MTVQEKFESTDIINNGENDYLLDFTTSSAIGRLNLEFLLFYILVFWFGGFGSIILLQLYMVIITNFILSCLLFPFIFGLMYVVFVTGSVIVAKLFLVLLNLIHKPKEGIFLAQKGNKDYDFWCYRIELKKIGIWLTNNFPLPWVSLFPLRWFGVKIDFSSHFQDAWIDLEFINFGRKVMVGQGAVVLSSMIVGKYLIIKRVIFDDYVVVGGQATIAPGTIIGKDTVIGALSTTNFIQYLQDSWIYFGIPAIKLKPNKYAESRSDIIKKVDVDEMRKYKVIHEKNSEKDIKKEENNHLKG